MIVVRSIRRLLVCAALLSSIAACQPPNHYLIHPNRVPINVVSWENQEERGALRIHLQWAKPPGGGPFPTVLVHPEGGKTANEMKGVIWDLASRGYLAIAADYKRMIDGKYRRNLFAWRDDSDVTAALDVISRSAFVDHERIATLGFSQGGIFSLMIAAHAPDRIRAVVAYYPVTDFEYWFDSYRRNPIERLAYQIIRARFRQQSGARTEAEFRSVLRRASPLAHAQRIQAPVLLIHGEDDKAAAAKESQRLAERLAALGRTVKLMRIPGAVHIFNFRQPRKATVAWESTLQWLAQHLQTPMSYRAKIAKPILLL